MAERRRHDETHGVHACAVLITLAALVLGVAIVAGAVHALASWWDAPLGGPNGPLEALIAGPRLESAPQYEASRYADTKEALLHRYEWIDRQHGIARIPIEDAMRVMAAPAQSRVEGPAQGDQQAEVPR